jgi:non-heme chloroperoxidase
MPFLELTESPHAPGLSPVKIYYRESGSGTPLLFLHGGWGYGYYPIDSQIEEFGGRFRFLIPDRSGYGRSSRVTGKIPLDFHRRAAMEMTAFLDALGIGRCILWGHSDGAVIAAMMGLAAPERCERIVLEAFHFYRGKEGSRSFFARAAANPMELGEGTRKKLAADHGETHWQDVVRRNSDVWVRMGERSERPGEDLFAGRLGELSVPALFVHGRLDPRTEPGEIERAHEDVPASTLRMIENGKHCPHSEEAAVREFNTVLGEFLPARN